MERFLITCEPTNESHVYKGKDFRISVLSDRLFRIELGKADAFEDRPTQTVLCRSFATPDVDFSLKGANLTVTTNSVVLKFNTQIKTVKIKDRKTNAYLSTKGNLGGTRRTLDMRLGAVDLGKGLMAKGGVSMFDDGKSLVLEGGMVVPRKKVKDYYIFAHNHDYLGCLKDFYNLTGKVPVIPKFALSNWWSRYFPYSEESYLALMDEFISRKIPITVATIDMDWHLVKEVPKEYKGSNIFLGRGWTGYTWNKKLFPDPQRFLKALKDRGFWTTLNIHPADGIRAFEDPYPEMARAMGIDPATKKTVEFDLTDKKFLLAYFDVLHRPFEKD
ncbi:MAG: hypothetical protein GX891_00110, partial [Clostridiales bacterium]|nr:hypothetical protein [Clostridiales bacterium]